ncbi:two component transcriptional regulator, winged helix family [Sulfurimonas denitrificans DSM 1251]|uniref:Two component transcriptional regulator, winged helix family n=1 Tax=Sulfurimonas denitrificans (strain ATCC 33889 / DSM 1251) TaxID=326298 RepID=Q30SX7_SULDN|nr:response regulator transcription factor [Sulfurimonas denitrificans]ABB43904.1 two component transcriptional regulator, winged helix family [Sulfurimonas denitrificans DSM 1251]MDD3442379.1 response regulator transcription factor [Sulfurimonas denitrificans]
MSKILFLEDDLLFAETLIDLLEENNMEVVHVPNGQAALDRTFKEKFNLYLLDINVPLVDGVTLLRELRESDDDTPAIFLTSHKEKEVLKKGFLCGADDFITKPFDADELILRILAIIKRAKKEDVTCIGLLCNDDTHKRFLYDNKEIELSKKEYQLLRLLIKHANNTVPKEMIIDTLWSSSEGGSDGALRVYINRIKQLVPQINIENIRGVGYKLVS